MTTESTAVRGYKRTTVANLCNRIERNVELNTITERHNLVAKLEKYRAELDDLNEKISLELWANNASAEEKAQSITKAEEYDRRIERSLVLLQESIARYNTDEEANSSSRSNENSEGAEFEPRNQRLKLPEVPLPTFSNDKSETLDHFLDTFENVVEKYSLTSYEKFILLKNQLRNEPRILINSLSTSEQSYVEARDLLERAFSSETTKKFDAIKRLVDLRLTRQGNAYEYVGEMRLVHNLFDSLSISTEDIMRYFTWNSMTLDLQAQLIYITNSNKPTLNEITNNIFKAIDRLREIGERTVKDSGNSSNLNSDCVTGLAANIEYDRKKRQFCSLCSTEDRRDTSHSIKDCQNFKSAESKRRRLELIGGCVLCGYQNHKSSDCRFKFNKKCFNCGKPHMTFLCVAAIGKHRNVVDRVHTGTVWTTELNTKIGRELIPPTFSCLNTNVGREVILPTFSCLVNNMKIRCLKDTGCQPNFVLDKVAKSLNLPIVHTNHPMVVNGFNESQTYWTNVVLVPLMIGDKCFTVEAVCTPIIKTTLTLPGLSKCVEQFRYKGYKLADDYLSSSSDVIDNLDFMLGSNSPGVLIENQIPFGVDDECVYSETKAGVMVFGNLKCILNNINYLPSINSRYSDDFSFESRIAEHDLFHSAKMQVTVDHVVVSEDNSINSKQLNKALDEMMQMSLNYDNFNYNEPDTIVNRNAIDYVLGNCSRSDSGRLVMPLIWNKEVEHLLGKNYGLAKSILFSGLKKFSKTPNKLQLIDDVFKQQLEEGIIEKVDDIDQFMNENEVSFLPHMPVFKPDSLTTKVRVVFLSNLCESRSDRVTMSHNQVIHAGPCLNEKITTAVTNLRFGEYLLTYDLRKAFLQISLPEADSNRLLFLWFKDVAAGNYDLVAYKNLRLTFGLRSSPTMLMLAMYKILCIDTERDDDRTREFKRLLYALLYMDNGAVTGSLEEVKWAYESLPAIFERYCFKLQQFTTNITSLQEKVDSQADEATPETVKLLGLNWNRISDKISARPIDLNTKANTKRLVLKTIASQFDMHNFHGPLLNRSRIFLHKLQCDKELDWDTKLSTSLYKEWSRISSQANKSGPVLIDRYVGDRSHQYDLICFSDASKDIYAVVLYLHNLTTGKVSFLTAKNRFINKHLEHKTIPELELQGIVLGVESLVDMLEQLSGDRCMCPININELKLYTDSMISLHWLNAYNYKIDKMSSLSVFKLNRLHSIKQMCSKQPVSFHFVSTGYNPADCMTRTMSYKKLLSSCYIDGPEFITDGSIPVLSVNLPNPDSNFDINSVKCQVYSVTGLVDSECCVDLNRFSSFKRAVGAQAAVRRAVDSFVGLCKSRLQGNSVRDLNCNYYDRATIDLIKDSQQKHFSDVFNFFANYSTAITKDIPDIVNKLNLFIDNHGVIRVKAKMGQDFSCPILLSKNSRIANLIIHNTHVSMAHSGCYTILSQLRKKYWIDCFFSTVKKILKSCVICRRLNGRTIKLNQNDYRDDRQNPDPEPFKFIYFDHLGPFSVYLGKERKKVWLLLITCMWSRAVNIKICDDLSVKSFLKAFQMHTFDYGIPSRAFSDLGSQLTAGAKIIEEYHKDKEFIDYFDSNGIKPIKFEQYFKGNSAMGSLVEICVKYCKKLIYGSIRNNILQRSEFEFITSHSVCLINKRPIAFQDALRETRNVELPETITPELLVKGRNLNTVNVIPALDVGDDSDPEYFPGSDSKEELRKELSKLRKVQSNLVERYKNEFLQQLISQAVDKKDRYKPVGHKKLEVGDIVLIRDPMLKVYNYPMAVVTKTFENSISEVTNVEVFKGRTGENVKRHVTQIIPLLKPDSDIARTEDIPPVKPETTSPHRSKTLERVAKAKAKLKLSEMSD